MWSGHAMFFSKQDACCGAIVGRSYRINLPLLGGRFNANLILVFLLPLVALTLNFFQDPLLALLQSTGPLEFWG